MTSRITIYDRNGEYLREVTASTRRTWALNAVGDGEFSLSGYDPNCNWELLRPGNHVFIEHDQLPPWCGWIDLPIHEGAAGVTVSLYSAEDVLNYRTGPSALTVTGTAGSLFRRMLAIANQGAATLIQPGSIFEGGTARQETLNLTEMLSEIQRVSKRSGNDFEFVPDVSTGRLRLLANWYERLGSVVDVTLRHEDNAELKDPYLSLQGRIVNDLTGVGQGASAQSRPTHREQDAASAGEYGVRQGTVSFDGVSQSGTLQSNTQTELRRVAQPEKVFHLAALNKDGLFSRLRLGVVLRLAYQSRLFRRELAAWVRITAMRYDDRQGEGAGEKIELVCEEVQE